MKKGFTLTELLMAMTIVGVIAVLTVPILMNNIQNRVFANQVKNMAATIEQLAQDELIAHRTRDLSDTDFGDPAKLLSDKHFSIVKKCTASNSKKDCWKTTATGKDKVTYKFLNKSGNANPSTAGITIMLKNGVIMRYTKPASTYNKSEDIVGQMLFDINGNDKPNIAGRDFFGFFVTNKGKIVDRSYTTESDDTLETKITKCKNNNVYYCYGALIDNGWKMDY